MINVDRSSRTSLRRLAVAGTLVAASVFGAGAAASAAPTPSPSVAEGVSQFASWGSQNWTGTLLLVTNSQDFDGDIAPNDAESARNNMVNRHWCGLDHQGRLGRFDLTIVQVAYGEINSFGGNNNKIDKWYSRRGACDGF